MSAPDAAVSHPVAKRLTDGDDWREPVEGAPLPFWPSVLADALGRLPAIRRPRGTRARVALLVRVALTSAGFRAALLYRMGHTARSRGGTIGRIVAAVLYWCGRHWYGCSLASTARLHGGLVLPHPQGIVIGGDVVIGPGAWVFQNVTVGGAPERTGMPRIGADARIYAGAVIAGPVQVGDEVMIGANAVVSRDVPSRSAVRVPTVTTALAGSD